VFFNTLSITNIHMKAYYVESSRCFLRMISYLVSCLNDSDFNMSNEVCMFFKHLTTETKLHDYNNVCNLTAEFVSIKTFGFSSFILYFSFLLVLQKIRKKIAQSSAIKKKKKNAWNRTVVF